MNALAALAVCLAVIQHSGRVDASTVHQTGVSKCPVTKICAFAARSTAFLGSFASTSNTRALLAPVRPTAPLTALSMVTSIPVQSELSEDEVNKRSAEARQAAASKPLDVHVMGLSHHNAAVDVREKLAIPGDQWVAAAAELVAWSNGAIEEAAVLSTCNRFEVYFSARDGREAMRAATTFFAERSGLSQGVLRRNLFMLAGEDASWHLLRVSAGLDSIVVGEGQILSQVSKCFQAATQQVDEENPIAGSGGKVLARMLNTAVASGKRVRSETSISKGAVSISSAAVEFSVDRCPKDLTLPLKECGVAIVGAGTMTRLLVTHLKSHGVDKITLINRSIGPGSRAAELVEENPDVAWELATPDQMYDKIAVADVVYMSTSSEVPIVDRVGLAEAGLNARETPIDIVDISVPRNVDADVSDLEAEGIFSYNVDDLKAVVARNTAARRKEIIEAEKLLKEEHQGYHGWHQSLGAIPTITKLQERAEVMREEVMKKETKKLRDLSEKELDAVDRLSRGIVNKLLHGPMSHLRSPESAEDKRRSLSALSGMFKLEEEAGTRSKGKGGKRGGRR